MSRNTTTNETYKWDDYVRYVRYYIKNQKETEEKKIKEKNEPIAPENNNLKKRKQDKNSKGEQKKQIELEEVPPPKFKLDKNGKISVKNIYNKGVLKNLWEVFNPPSYR